MEILENLSLTNNNFNLYVIIGSLTLSVILCLIVVYVYMITHRQKGYDQDYLQSLIFMGIIISSVMLVIGNNLAGAFGLVGAVSIIRFRTNVENPKDTAYIFLVMGIGLSCGLRQYVVAVITTFFVSIVLIAFWKFNVAKSTTSFNGNLLSIRFQNVSQGRILLEKVFENEIKTWKIVSIQAIDESSGVVNYKISFKNDSSPHLFIKNLYDTLQGKMIVLRYESA